MTTDFIVKPEYTGMGSWERATVRINTKKGADACNEYFGTERQKGDSFNVSSKNFKEFEMMRDANHLSSVFG